MTKTQKVCIASGIAVLSVAVAYTMLKKKDYASYTIDPETKDFVEEEKVDSRIKRAAEEKVTEILAFVVVHKEQIEAAGTIIGLVGGAIGIVNAVKEYKTQDKNTELLEKIWAHCSEFEDLWDNHQTNLQSVYSKVDSIGDVVLKGGKKK